MNLTEAEKKLWENEEVKDRKKEGYYLSSIMLILDSFDRINSWHFVFFEPQSKNVFTAEVDEQNIKIGKPSQPLVEEHYEELSLEGVKPKKVLELIKEKSGKLVKNKTCKILLTLRENTWRAAITTSDLTMIRLDIEKGTHKVLKDEISSMLR